jgi:hypothetical protein
MKFLQFSAGRRAFQQAVAPGRSIKINEVIFDGIF